MELKNYQKAVIADLERFLELVNTTPGIDQAYKKFWEEKDVPVGGLSPMPAYNNILPGTPHVCFKVPTGGGKTYLACNAVKPVFDALPMTKIRAVAWLVPSDAILEQTRLALSDSRHPYRQKLDIDFGGRVEVYTKDQLLSAQNFNPTSVAEQLSIFVLSYDSFRSSKKDGRKAYQENGYLAPFTKSLGAPEQPIEGADESALIQIINQLSPLVIVDESHHAQSDLSVEMLRNFNPCFVLDLTATPKKNSNIISFVDALQLKREKMVKLPVIVYNRKSRMDVMVDAIDLRRKLEADARLEAENGGGAIRPIVLFQAQPKTGADSTTFEKIKAKLVDLGISADEIAIKTAEINELKNVNLLASDCKIRYIITVNALKEGWDCPYAYILATVANRSSQVDVEQILGRILRQPFARQHSRKVLNMSYVLTSSDDFTETLNRVVKGMNSAGFSRQDCRAEDTLPPVPPQGPVIATQPGLPCSDSGENADVQPVTDDFSDINAEAGRQALAERETPSADNAQTATPVSGMLENALRQGDVYEAAANETNGNDLPREVANMVNHIRINEEFKESADGLELPQFFIDQPGGLFADAARQLLSRETLAEGFTLRDKDTMIRFNNVDSELAQVDIEGKDQNLAPKWREIRGSDSVFLKQYFASLTPESKLRQCKQMIHRQLSKMDMLDDGELHSYIDRVIENISGDHLAALQNAPFGYANKIKEKIESLLSVYNAAQFERWIEQGRIVCAPSWKFKEEITPLNTISSIAKSLYSSEADMNGYEKRFAMLLTGMQNIVWWHRNIENTGFCINGFINHYPDFIAMTSSGKVLAIETKGDHLDNPESERKLKLGRIWQNKSGEKYRYYMVFEEKNTGVSGSYSFDDFTGLLEGL